jgi:hypothetical protein
VHLSDVRIVDPRKGIVEARSGLGRLRFTWQGEPPPDGGDHHVEVDVPDLLEWGREIWRAADGVPDPPPPKGQRLRGRLVGIDEHGVATIRAGDGFLLVETLGDPPLGTVDEEVELETLHLHAFPTHY